MNEPSEIKLSLLDNSHAFLNEAVTYAIAAHQGDVRKWQFAVLNLVQSLELSLKSLLYDIHPIFIYENIDAPKHTVGPLQALDRLNHTLIADTKLPKMECRRIKNAINLRNQMMHSEFTLKPEYATAKFFETFSFIVFFQARHFDCEIENIISDEQFGKLIAIERAFKELAEKAAERILEEDIDNEFVFQCPNCENDTFVIQDDINTCYACRNTAEICECPKCGSFVFPCDMHDFSMELDIDICEGQGIMVDNYGYDYYKACSECLEEIKEDISQQRWVQQDELEREEYYWRKKHAEGF